jgi:hypothetical protein
VLPLQITRTRAQGRCLLGNSTELYTHHRITESLHLFAYHMTANAWTVTRIAKARGGHPLVLAGQVRVSKPCLPYALPAVCQ